MNDDELRRRLLEPIGEGSTDFWSSVDQSLEDVEATDGFVTALPVDDPGRQPTNVTPIGRSARSFRAVLAAAAVLVIGAGGLAASLLDRSSDSVTTNQPAAEADDDGSEQVNLTDPLSTLPVGTEICYLESDGAAENVARAELLAGAALSGYALFPSEDVPLETVDRFVGRLAAGGDVVSVSVTRFDPAGESRRNTDWTINAAQLVTEDTTLGRIACDELPSTPGVVNGSGEATDEQLIEILVAESESTDRSLALRPLDDSTETTLGLNGVDIRSGETVAFRFEAEAGDVLSYEITASSVPSGVVLVGPADLALAVGLATAEVTIPHAGTHHLVVSADVGLALSVTVSN